MTQTIEAVFIDLGNLVTLKYDRLTGRYFEPDVKWNGLTRVV